jgi:hypothetical protein
LPPPRLSPSPPPPSPPTPASSCQPGTFAIPGLPNNCLPCPAGTFSRKSMASTNARPHTLWQNKQVYVQE